jgi:uncharacterized protein
MFPYHTVQGPTLGHATRHGVIPSMSPNGLGDRRGMRRTASRFFRALILSSLFCIPAAYAAETPRQIDWQDLVVSLPAAENPFASLSPEQMYMITDIGGFRARRARGETLLPQEVEIERTSIEKLQSAGIPIDSLLAQQDTVRRKLEHMDGVANASLDGKLVRMAGYPVPVKFVANQVTEFFLVPYVRSDPPPPNQVVYVKSVKPFEIKGISEQILVTGRMSASPSTKQTYVFNNGKDEIEGSYAIDATQVEPYKK